MATLSGGKKLVDALNRLAAKINQKATLRVGFLEGSTYPDGTSVPMVAAIQEFGAPKRGIPPRPFFRNMIAQHENEWPDKLAQLYKANNSDIKTALMLLGEDIAGDLRESIIATNSPPLSPITVMLRGMKANNPNLKVTGKTVGEAAARVKAGKTNYGASNKPLVDSGHLLDSIDYEVKTP